MVEGLGFTGVFLAGFGGAGVLITGSVFFSRAFGLILECRLLVDPVDFLGVIVRFKIF